MGPIAIVSERDLARLQIHFYAALQQWLVVLDAPDEGLDVELDGSDPAILLRKMPWSETSLIVTWLTERFGTARTVARGARRPKRVRRHARPLLRG